MKPQSYFALLLSGTVVLMLTSGSMASGYATRDLVQYAKPMCGTGTSRHTLATKQRMVQRYRIIVLTLEHFHICSKMWQ